jgi:hypothetical protein
MVHAVRDLIESSHLVHWSAINEDTLAQPEKTLKSFHENWEIFWDLGVCPEGFSLPCQHLLMYYPILIKMFGAPNGLCSSITESKHIKVVKKKHIDNPAKINH